MNLGKNIHNAFEVVNKTYENVNKLMTYCSEMAVEEGEYVLVSPKFLRWKSDNNYWAWNIRSFILLFQNAEDQELENEWRQGPIYVMEINLYDPDYYEQPMINIAKFEYKEIAKWNSGCSPASHYIFYNPLYELNYEQDEEGMYRTEVEADYGNRYWGLQNVIVKEIPLVEINGGNAYEKIFGGFNSLGRQKRVSQNHKK